MVPQFVYLFPFLFGGIFVLVIFILSKKGWADLAEVYAYNEPFEGEQAGITSMTINGVNYNNCLLLKYNDQGFYMRPILMFRLFHKPLFIPYKDIKDIRPKKLLFTSVKEMVIGDPAIAIIQMKETTSSQLEHMMMRKNFYPANK